MTARGRSCFRLSDAVIAACVAMLKEERTVRSIHAALGISGASVYDIRRKHMMGIDRTHGRKLAEVSRKDLPTCQWCGLLAPCSCVGPIRAEQFLGRRGEQNCSEFSR